MVSFIGNNFKPKGIGLIPSRKVIEGGYKTIIGNGSGLFSNYLNRSLLIHACDIERYILYNGVFTGPFVANEPAWRYVSIPGYGSIPLLQVERSSTNLVTYSEAFRAAVSDWLNLQTDVTDDNLAVTGTDLIADLLYEDSSNNNHEIRNNYQTDGSSKYCGSFFVKAFGRNFVEVRFTSAGLPTAAYADFDVVNGVAYDNSGNTGYGLISASNMYRCWIRSQNSNSVTSGNFRCYLSNTQGNLSYQGDGSSGSHIIGAQVEKLEWVSSYIKTSTSTEIRPIVTGYIASANVPAWLQTEFVIPWVPYGSSSQFANTDHILCEMRDSIEDWTLYFKGSTGEVILTGSVTGDILTKSAITFSALGDPILFDFTLNNGSVASLTVSGADTGDGTQAASQAISFDGNFHIGTDHTGGNEADGLIWVIKS